MTFLSQNKWRGWTYGRCKCQNYVILVNNRSKYFTNYTFLKKSLVKIWIPPFQNCDVYSLLKRCLIHALHLHATYIYTLNSHLVQYIHIQQWTWRSYKKVKNIIYENKHDVRCWYHTSCIQHNHSKMVIAAVKGIFFLKRQCVN